MSRDQQRYSIGELSAQAEVSRRAVRYYIQRGLLPAAHGAGRGSYYDGEHLSRLIALREAQRAGLSLEELSNPGAAPMSPARLSYSSLERWLRLPCASGVELHVLCGALQPERLAELSALIQDFLTTPPRHTDHSDSDHSDSDHNHK